MWKTIQIKANSQQVVQLILDMKVRWSSTYFMLDRAERKKDVRNIFTKNDQSLSLFFYSVSTHLLMNFDGKNKTPLSVIRFVSSDSRVRSGCGSTPSLVY
jgi:hypothetical protein